MTTEQKLTDNKYFNDYVEKLKKAGFRVFIPKDRKYNFDYYAHFSKGSQIGYFEVNKYGTFSFSSVHKPCYECGTGFSIHREITNPSISCATDCFITAPHWAFSKEREAVKKYASIESYLNQETIIEKEEV